MHEVDIKSLQLNPWSLIGDRWMLITAGNKEDGFNTMTAAWGHFGTLFGSREGSKNTTICYIRPQRYTKTFMDSHDIYTLSFLPDTKDNKKKLAYLGTKSGRDEDKVSRAQLTPLFVDGTTTFEEAELTFVCRKIYVDDLIPENFVDKSIIEQNYPLHDFHTRYIGEVLKVYVAD